jgi:hypothetical protein
MNCIYCGQNEATERYCGVGCGCAETPADMDLEASASVGVAKPRCPDCGEFAENCTGHGQSRGTVREFGFGGRVIGGGED